MSYCKFCIYTLPSKFKIYNMTLNNYTSVLVQLLNKMQRRGNFQPTDSETPFSISVFNLFKK